jgi:hypothetical protein
MSKQIFKLRNVPDDEAEEIRQLLTESNIDFYETPAGNWGISMPAFWLNDENEHKAERAKDLIKAYQVERGIRKREEYKQLKREGKHRTLVDAIREQPMQFLVYLAIAALIIYLSTKPFLDLAGN